MGDGSGQKGQGVKKKRGQAQMVSLGDTNASHQGLLINIIYCSLRKPGVSTGPAGQATVAAG